MVTPKTGRPVGRPPAADKVAAILDASWALFLAHGVEAVAVETIAARAGVAKATVYKHFPDKAALFEAGVRREMMRIEAAQRPSIPAPAADTELAAQLRQFGFGILSFLVSDGAVDFYGALAGELRRHEALARRFYEAGPGRTRANLAALLAAAAARGELDLTDPDEAAEHLFGLWQGFSNFQLSLGVEGARVRATLAERVARGVDVFLRAYAPAAPPPEPLGATPRSPKP